MPSQQCKGLNMRVRKQPRPPVRLARPVLQEPVAEASVVSNNTNNPRNVGWMMALTSALTVSAVVLCLVFISNPFIAISLSVTAGIALVGGWVGYFIALRSNDLHNVLMSTKGAVEDVRETVRQTSAHIKPLARRANKVIESAHQTVRAVKKEVRPTAHALRRTIVSVNGAVFKLGGVIAETKKQVAPLAKSTQGAINAVHGAINTGKKVLVSTKGAIDSGKNILDVTTKEIPEVFAITKKEISDVAKTTKETITGNAPVGLAKNAASSLYNAIGRVFGKKEGNTCAVIEEGIEGSVDLTRAPNPVIVQQKNTDSYSDSDSGSEYEFVEPLGFKMSRSQKKAVRQQIKSFSK